MKTAVAVSLVCVLLAIIYFWYINRTNPKLVALAGQDQKIVFWADLSTDERNLVAEAIELTKSELGKTLELRQQSRNSTFANQLPETIYIVEFKDSYYLMKDNYPYKAPGLEVPGKSLVNSIEFNKRTKGFRLISASLN